MNRANRLITGLFMAYCRELRYWYYIMEESFVKSEILVTYYNDETDYQ